MPAFTATPDTLWAKVNRKRKWAHLRVRYYAGSNPGGRTLALILQMRLTRIRNFPNVTRQQIGETGFKTRAIYYKPHGHFTTSKVLKLHCQLLGSMKTPQGLQKEIRVIPTPASPRAVPLLSTIYTGVLYKISNEGFHIFRKNLYARDTDSKF